MAIASDTWQPGFYLDGALGPNGNTYRAILQLEVGDNLNLQRVIGDAEHIKSAIIWRTKDGWELRGSTYSGIYGVSIEPEDIKKDTDLFDQILIALDSEPPFEDRVKCKCGCGAPYDSGYLRGHDDRYRALNASESVVPAVEQEPVDDTPPVQGEAATEEDAAQDVATVNTDDNTEEVDAQDAELANSPQEPEADSSDPYAEYIDSDILGQGQEAFQEKEPEAPPALTSENIISGLDSLLQNPEVGYPSNVDLSVDMIGIVDEYSDQDPFPQEDRCACGCGAPTSSTYLFGHNLRYAEVDSILTPMLKKEGDREQHIEELVKKRDDANSLVVRSLFNEAIYRLRNGYTTLDSIKPSNNKDSVMRYALRFALAESGYYVSDIKFQDNGMVNWQEMPDLINLRRFKVLWDSKKNEYLRQATNFLDQANHEEPTFVIAAKKQQELISKAVAAGSAVTSIVEDGFMLQFASGNPPYSLNAMLNGLDQDSQAPVSDTNYRRYRQNMEFSGQDFDPLAKYYNYIWLQLVKNKLSFNHKIDLDEDKQVAALQIVEAVKNHELDRNPEFIKDFANWWNKHGRKAYGYAPSEEFLLLARYAKDYSRTQISGFESARIAKDSRHSTKLYRQDLDIVEDQITNSKYGRFGKAILVADSPFEGDYFMVHKSADKSLGSAVVRPSERQMVYGRMIDAGADVLQSYISLKYDDGEIHYHSSGDESANDDNKKRMAAKHWIDSNIGSGPFCLTSIKDGPNQVGLVVSKDKVIWVGSNASPETVKKLKTVNSEFLYNSDVNIKYANIVSENGQLVFKSNEQDGSMSDKILASLEEAGIVPTIKHKLELVRNDSLVGNDGSPMSLVAFYDLFVKSTDYQTDTNTSPNAGKLLFANLSPKQIIDFVSETFGAHLEKVVPADRLFGTQNHFGKPVVYQNDYSDGLIDSNLGHFGIVHQFGTSVDDLSEIADAGGIFPARSGSAEASPLDQFVFSSFSNRGGAVGFTKFKHYLIFNTELAYSVDAIYSGYTYGPHRPKAYEAYMENWGGNLQLPMKAQSIAEPQRLMSLKESAEIGIRGGIGLQSAYALVVPASYRLDANAQKAIKSMRLINKNIKVVYVNGDEKQMRIAAKNLVSEYNETHGFNNKAMLEDNLGNDSGLLDVHIKPSDTLLVRIAGHTAYWSGVVPVEVISTDNEILSARIYMTPKISDMLRQHQDFAGILSDRNILLNDSPNNFDVDLNDVVWLSPEIG
jgi:hypothetical protein